MGTIDAVEQLSAELLAAWREQIAVGRRIAAWRRDDSTVEELRGLQAERQDCVRRSWEVFGRWQQALVEAAAEAESGAADPEAARTALLRIMAQRDQVAAASAEMVAANTQAMRG
jgi:hypothetical protein